MKISAFLFCPLVALLWAACSSSNGNEPDESITPNDKPVELNVRATISQPSVSRASDTKWDANDSIGITAYNNPEMAARYKNVRYQTTGDGSFTSKTPIYFINDQTVELKAYYPYSASGGGILKNNTRAENQTPERKRTIDYLWADLKDLRKETPNPTFGFIRAMSQIAITFQQGEGVDLKDVTSYTISGLKLEGEFNTDEGTATASGSPEDLTLNITGKQGSSLAISPVILYPQTVSSFDVKVILGGEVYSCKGLTLQSGGLVHGYIYNYTLTIKKTVQGPKLEMTQTEIMPWTPENGGEGILYPES